MRKVEKIVVCLNSDSSIRVRGHPEDEDMMPNIEHFFGVVDYPLVMVHEVETKYWMNLRTRTDSNRVDELLAGLKQNSTEYHFIRANMKSLKTTIMELNHMTLKYFGTLLNLLI